MPTSLLSAIRRLRLSDRRQTGVVERSSFMQKTKSQKQQSVTTLPPSPDEERRQRMVRYSVAMGVRMLCFILVFAVPGWWKLVFAIGAIVLPYFAVVLANVSMRQSAGVVERPGAVVRIEPRPDDTR